jgi:hypothetical protein
LVVDVTGFSDESLRILLTAQEYPKGDFARAIEYEQLLCVGRRMKVVEDA